MSQLVLFKIFIVSFSIINSVQCKIHSHGHDGSRETDSFSNEWVVHLDEANEEIARLLALKMGYDCLGEIFGFPGYFLMRKPDHPEVSNRDGIMHTQNLQEDERVLWAQQLFRKSRVKRDLEMMPQKRGKPDVRVPISAFGLQRRLARMQIPRNPFSMQMDDPRGIPSYLLDLWDKEESGHSSGSSSVARDNSQLHMFNDRQWKDQWYMTNNRKARSIGEPEVDLHIVQVYQEFGLSGAGMKVVVLDDGLEYTHPDISKNYDPSISYDYNNGTRGDPDPFPDQSKNHPNSHGTRCAGEIAMVANNHVCGVGVAYEASIGAIRMLDGVINDRVEGLSLQHAIDKVDIFSASWGPNDDGKTVEAPGRLAQTALLNGIQNGRNGKGVIYVWASGNGGMNDDSCACDGYTSSMYTISIGSASERGRFPWYGEKCASTLATTYSSGDFDEKKVATTDTNSECTEGHTGTSAAAPLAAGIIALVLQHNPSLTWRDVQHLIIWSSTIESVRGNPGWYLNKIGLPYNHRFGYGVMDAYRMVTMATNWKNVEEQHTCSVDSSEITNPTLSNYSPSIVTFTSTDGCQKDPKKVVNYLEHVEVRVNIEYPRRGNLEVVLESPTGTMSQLLTYRSKDVSKDGFKDWAFTSVHFWGEDSAGPWKLYILDRTNQRKAFDTNFKPEGKLGKIQLLLHGTKNMAEIQNETENPKFDQRLQDFADKNLSLMTPLEKLENFLANESPVDEPDSNKKLNWDKIFGGLTGN